MDSELPNGTPVANLLSSLLSDPARMEQLKNAVGSVLTEASDAPQAQNADPSPSEPTKALPANTTITAPTDGLSSLLSDPALMAQLPRILAAVKPMMAELPPMAQASHEPSAEEKRRALLLALKPFLSSERQNALDALLRISQLGIVFKQFL